MSLASVSSKHPWRHTHNASVRNAVIPLSAEPFGPAAWDGGPMSLEHVLLFEYGAKTPSWAISLEGSLTRLRDDRGDGVVVAVTHENRRCPHCLDR